MVVCFGVEDFLVRVVTAPALDVPAIAALIARGPSARQRGVATLQRLHIKFVILSVAKDLLFVVHFGKLEAGPSLRSG